MGTQSVRALPLRVALLQALALGSVFLIAGYLVLTMWWDELVFQITRSPSFVLPLTTAVAFGGIFISLGLMITGVLPKFHPARIAGYGIGCCAFLVNLALQRNDGNVILEVALVLLSIWSIATNSAKSAPICRDWWTWLHAMLVLGGCALTGIGAATLWTLYMPHLAGGYWATVAKAGAVVLFVAYVCHETKVFPEKSWMFPAAYGTGNAILCASYLGQPTMAGEALNFAMCALMFGPLVWRAVMSYQRPILFPHRVEA